MTDDIHLRPASLADLEKINRVIEAAITAWDLPERVKRLALSSYHYTETDFHFLHMIIAEHDESNIIGVATWEQADKKYTFHNANTLLLHGIYVDPGYQYKGVGQRLFTSIEEAAREHHFDSLVVKAQQGAKSFFIKQGMQRLAVDNEKQQYANRFWKKI